MDDFERIYRDWHEYAKNRDTDALIALYADDAVFESPLVPAIMDTDSGILCSKAEILRFLQEGTRRRPNDLVRWYRDGRYFVAGDTLVWEYPPPNARRRSGGYFGSDAAGKRQNQAPPHLLGLVRHADADSFGTHQSG